MYVTMIIAYSMTFMLPFFLNPAPSVWTEHLNVALVTAISIKAGSWCVMSLKKVLDLVGTGSVFGRDEGKDVSPLSLMCV